MNRLHRSKRNKVILGVCGGLGEYFHIDPTLVRIIGIIIAISGFGVIMYLVAALIMPEDTDYSSYDSWNGGPETNSGAYSGTGTDTGFKSGSESDFEKEFKKDAEEWDHPANRNPEKNKMVLGAILVGLGVLFLGKQIMPWLFNLKFLVPILLIGIGGFIAFKGRR